MSGENIVAIVGVVMVFGGGGIRYAIGAFERIVTLNLTEGSRRNDETSRAVEDLRREVAALRETSTTFDMSFDAAITRLEERVERTESGQAPRVTTAHLPPTTLRREDASAPVTLSAGTRN